MRRFYRTAPSMMKGAGRLGRPTLASTLALQIGPHPVMHSPGTWERHQLFYEASVILTVRILSQTFDPLFPCFIKSSTFIPLM